MLLDMPGILWYNIIKIQRRKTMKWAVAAALSDDKELKDNVAKSMKVIIETTPRCLLVHRDGETWEVRRSRKTDEVYCTCPKWRFRKDKSKPCHHIIAVLEDGVKVPYYSK
jgi:hypothetical protein